MARVINTIRKNRIWVNDIELTSALIDGSVTDTSPLTQSLMTTSGTIRFSSFAAGRDILDVDKTLFPVGSSVVIATELPNGNVVRHPRGQLYLMNSSVDVASRTISMDVGCSLAFLVENEESYPEKVRQLFAFVDQTILDLCKIDAFTLGALQSCLQISGLALFQNQYGQVWSVNVSDELNSADAPALVCYDKHTILSMTSKEDPRVISPTSYKVTAAYGKFAKNEQGGGGDNTDPDGSTTESGVDDGGVDGQTPVDPGAPGGGGADGGSGDGDPKPPTGQPYIKWDNQTVEGTGEFEDLTYWKLLVYSGMTVDQTFDDSLYNDWCGWFYQVRVIPEPPAEPKWNYHISSNEIFSETRTYDDLVQSSTIKYYNAEGQETSSVSNEQATWRSVGTGTIDMVADRAKQISDKWIEAVNEYLGKVNKAYTERDNYRRGSSAWFYCSCVADHWIACANGCLGLARSWFSFAASIKRSGLKMVPSRRTEVYNTIGKGGEILGKVQYEYENISTTPRYLDALRTSFERGAVPTSSQAAAGSLKRVKVTETTYTYYDNGSTKEVVKVLDLQNPSNNSVTTSFSADNKVNPAPASSTGKGKNDDPGRDKKGKKTKSTPGQAPTPDPENPGQDLPYPDTENGQKIDPTTGTSSGSATCPVKVEKKELQATTWSSVQDSPITSAGWLGAPTPYVDELQFPLELYGDQLENDDVLGCIATASNEAAAQALVNNFSRNRAILAKGEAFGYNISEHMRPELYNWRPFMDVGVRLDTINRGFHCKIASCVWAFDQDQALVNLDVFRVGNITLPPASLEPNYPVVAQPPNQEAAPATVINGSTTELTDNLSSYTVGQYLYDTTTGQYYRVDP